MKHFKIGLSEIRRTEKLNGVEHLVVPTVPILEGVHNGILIKADELEKSWPMWNNRPIFYDHPYFEEVNNKKTHEKFYIGTILNSEFDKDRIKWETWINKDFLKNKNPQTLDDLESGKMVEGSIGFWAVDYEFVAGQWNGEPYYEIDYGLIPDHYAVLGNDEDTGACSIADGCGLNRFKKEGDKKMYRRFISVDKKFISQEDIGTGENIEIDNSQDAAHTGSWGSLDHVDDRNTILEASNYVSLCQEMYLILDSDWKEAPSQSLHYPHHTVSDGKLIVSEEGVKAARSFLERSDTQSTEAAENHLKRHYNELGLEWDSDERNNKQDKNLESFFKKQIDKITNFIKGDEMNKKNLIMNNFGLSEEVYNMLCDDAVERMYDSIVSNINPNSGGENEEEPVVFEECEDSEKFIESVKEVGIENVQTFIELYNEHGLEKINDALDSYDKQLKEKEKETKELRQKLTDEYEISEDTVKEMGLESLKEFSEKLGVENKQKKFNGKGGVRHNVNNDDEKVGTSPKII